MFAVIKTGGKQYKVTKNDVLVLERLAGEQGETVSFGEVLMLGDGDTVTIGEPNIDGAQVTAELLETRKGNKITVFKKKRRKDYRRTKGHRQMETVVRITDILAKDEKPAAKKAAPKKTTAKKAEPKKAEAKPAAKKKAPAKAAAKPATKKAEPKKTAAKPAAAKKTAAKKPATKKAAPKKTAAKKED